MANLLFVGFRGGALRAARHRSDRAVFVVNRPPPTKYDLSEDDYFIKSSPTDVLSWAQSMHERDPFDAVIALTEAAVQPAANLRRSLGVSGLDPDVAIRCQDKAVMKRAAERAGIPCAAWELLGPQVPLADALLRQLGLPMVLKQRASSGSRGTQVLRKASDVSQALQPHWIAESFVDGVEMSVESFVVNGEICFTNVTEYLKPKWANIVPAELAEDERAKLLDFNREVIEALGVTRGMCHLEVYKTPSHLVFGELAVRAPGGKLMELIETAYGFNPWSALIDVELGQRPQVVGRAECYVGIWMIHPGAGRITAVSGIDEACRIPHVSKVHWRKKLGSLLSVREGTGQNPGWILAEGRTRDEVASALQLAAETINVDVDIEPEPS